tara:strand:- start:1813 stop:2541 length:729 start_codon:yes stop_codon:yes gene_type:complete
VEIGVIGFGRFGEFLTGHLSKDCRVYVYGRSDKSDKIKEKNAVPASLEEVCKKDVVVLAVPISEFEKVLVQIKDILKENSTVIDVCSVKEYPVKLMNEILPKKTQILATHPLFGPDSVKDSLDGKKVVICRVNVLDTMYNKIKDYLKKKNLIILEITPEEHDKEIAKSLLLTHFIGRALIDLKKSNLDIDTEGYKNLLRILNTAKNDTLQLFEDMNHYNKYAKNVREDFIRSINDINKELEK